MEEEELLTVKQAAELLGIGPTAVRNAIYRDRLPHQVKYDRILIRRADLEAYRQVAKKGRPKKSAE